MTQATELMDSLTDDRQLEIGGKTYRLHQINAEDAAFVLSYSSVVLPMLQKQQMFFMTYTVDMVSENDFNSIAAIKGWTKAKAIVNKSFTVDGMALEKAVEPFASGQDMITFYSQALGLVAKS